MKTNKTNVKKLIEQKQNRLNRLVNHNQLDQQTVNEQIKQYARLICGILGD